MENTDFENKSIIKQSAYSDFCTYVNKQNLMDYQLDRVKIEPQEYEEYHQQLYWEANRNYIASNQENESKVNQSQHHTYDRTNSEQFQNNEVYLPNPNSNKCEKCGLICNSMNQITEHVIKCHQSATALGNINNYNILPGNEITKTETEILDLNSYNVQCDQLNENKNSTSTTTSLINGDSSKSKIYNCSSCEKSFNSSSNLKRHYNTTMHKDAVKRSGLPDPATPINSTADSIHKTIQDGEKPYKCDQCAKQFNHKYRLTEHMYIHTGEKPFICSICGKGFSRNYQMIKHKKIHEPEILYKCDQCPKQFKDKYNFTFHTYLHNGKNPFSCSICGKGLMSKNNMIKHERMHRGEKPYKCDQCPQQFNDKSNLTCHMYIHTKKKPFNCNLCGS